MCSMTTTTSRRRRRRTASTVRGACGLPDRRRAAVARSTDAKGPGPADARRPLHALLLLYCWLSVGWCVGVIKEANGDRRRKMDGEVINLFTHYEIDDDTRSACPDA